MAVFFGIALVLTLLLIGLLLAPMVVMGGIQCPVFIQTYRRRVFYGGACTFLALCSFLALYPYVFAKLVAQHLAREVTPVHPDALAAYELFGSHFELFPKTRDGFTNAHEFVIGNMDNRHSNIIGSNPAYAVASVGGLLHEHIFDWHHKHLKP